MDVTIELEKETDGRWIAESSTGILCYGNFPADAARTCAMFVYEQAVECLMNNEPVPGCEDGVVPEFRFYVSHEDDAVIDEAMEVFEFAEEANDDDEVVPWDQAKRELGLDVPDVCCVAAAAAVEEDKKWKAFVHKWRLPFAIAMPVLFVGAYYLGWWLAKITR